MGFSIETGISALTVFFQGLLSFLSPCVLPLLPLYIGYLSGGAKTVAPDGSIRYQKSRVMLNTLFFIIGISFAFFLLGLGFTSLGRFFSGNRTLFSRIGGVLIILFGLYQLGLFGSRLFSRERRLPLSLEKLSMNPGIALILGFTFSFAWTPCVGPALTSVLVMASTSGSTGSGFLLIGVYTLGFVLPFLAVGLFTGTLLNFFKTHQRVVRYTVKIGGVLLILMGLMMVTGWMNGVTGYLSKFGSGSSPAQTAAPVKTTAPTPASTKKPAGKTTPAPDFTAYDQFGKVHTLSEYKGKTVFLNFWTTWCGYCKEEMPDIQTLYEKYGLNQNEVVILGVANPKAPGYPRNQDVSQEEVAQFLTDGGYTYPVVMDTTGDIFKSFQLSSFPTTFMIDTTGNVFGYIPGMLTLEMMEDIIRQTMESQKTSQP